MSIKLTVSLIHVTLKYAPLYGQSLCGHAVIQVSLYFYTQVFMFENYEKWRQNTYVFINNVTKLIVFHAHKHMICHYY